MDTSSVASGQTSNHLKWSDLDCFSQGRREAAPRNSFSYQTEPYESNGTDQRNSCEDRTGSKPMHFWTESSILAQDERWRRA